jgi:hypothetical protein
LKANCLEVERDLVEWSFERKKSWVSRWAELWMRLATEITVNYRTNLLDCSENVSSIFQLISLQKLFPSFYRVSGFQETKIAKQSEENQFIRTQAIKKVWDVYRKWKAKSMNHSNDSSLCSACK